MEEIQDIPTELFDPDLSQERTHFDDAEDLKLGENIAACGQFDPVIAWEVLAADRGVKRFMLAEGHRRWRGAKMVGHPTLKARILKSKPTPAQLAALRVSVDRHKKKFLPSERMAALSHAKTHNGWSVSQAAKNLGEDQSTCSKLLFIAEHGIAAIKQRFDEGALDIEGAYKAAHETANKQDEIAKLGKLTRDQVKRLVTQTDKPEAKVKSAIFVLPGNVQLIIKKPDLAMGGCVDLTLEFHRILKNYDRDGWDIRTTEKVMAQNAKPKQAPAAPQEKAQVQP